MKNIDRTMIVEQDIMNLSNTLLDYKAHFENKKFLITGAAGFLGKYFVKLIIALIRSNSSLTCEYLKNSRITIAF